MRLNTLFALLLALLPGTLSWAAQGTNVVRVDVNRLPPCVLNGTGPQDWSGFEVELLKFILLPRGYQIEFREVPEFEYIFDGIKAGSADIAVAGISVNAARERAVDFSHPTLHSGLGIMVSGERKVSWWYSCWAWVRTTFPSLLIACGIMLVFGHLMWIVERKRNPDFSKRYPQGALDGMWYVIIAITSVGFGDKMSRTALGRVLTAVLLVIGLGVAANLVADISAFKIEQRLDCSIQQANDLRGHHVATVRGTTSVNAITALGGSPSLLPTLSEAIAALEQGQVDAVVFDYPSLRYYEQQSSQRHLVTLQELREEDYAFAVNPGNNDLRKVLNQGLLELRENGTYDILRARFLGK